MDFICYPKTGSLRGSSENWETRYVNKNEVLNMITSPSYIERYKAFLEYAGRPTYLEYVTKPQFQLKLKRLI